MGEMEYLQSNLNFLLAGLPLNRGCKTLRAFFWIPLLFLFFSVGYNLLRNLLKTFLIHRATPKINQLRIVDGLWRVLFAAWTIGFFFFQVISVRDVNPQSLLQAATSPCNVTHFAGKNEDDTSEIFSASAPVTFFLHQLYTSLGSPFEPAVTSYGSLVIFVFVSNSVKCSDFCFQVLFFLALNVGSMELAKFCYALKSRCRGYIGAPAPKLLDYTAKSVVFVHIVIWISINFYLFPTLVLSQPSITEVAPTARAAAIFFNIFLICFAKQQFFCSPLWTLFKLLVKRPSRAQKKQSLESMVAAVLLPYSSSLLLELRVIHLQFLSEAPPTSAEIRMLRRKNFSSGNETATSKKISPEQAAELLSVIQCVKVLKRKMRHRYEQKQAISASVDVTDEAHFSEECKENEETVDQTNYCGNEGPPDVSVVDEVTDIFVPVPILTKKVASIDEKQKECDAVTAQGSVEVTAVVHFPAESSISELCNVENIDVQDLLSHDKNEGDAEDD